MVRQVVGRAGGAQVHHHRGRRPAQRPEPAWLAAQQPGALGGPGGENDCIARKSVVGGAHCGDAVSRAFELLDFHAVVEPHPCAGSRVGQSLWHGAHASAREPHAGHGVHVGDHGVGGEGVSRCDTGVERLEGEDPPQPFVVQGQMKGLAVSGAPRLAALPDTPSFGEMGLPKTLVDSGTWQGIVTTGGTPAATVAALSEAFRRVLAQPDIAAKVTELGGVNRAEGPDAFAAWMKDAIASWGQVVRAEGITLD